MPRISYTLSDAIYYRRTNRIFGDIDNKIIPLTDGEVVGSILDEEFIPKIHELYNRDDPMYKFLSSKKGG